MNFTYTLHRLRVPLGLILATLVVLMSTGCQRAPIYTDYSAFLQTQKTVEYRMAPPDVIQIESSRVKEINAHIETISPDGRIHLPLLGSILVAGRTPEEVSAELEERAQYFYDQADVTLRVSRYASKKFFVFGHVTRPGTYFYNGNNTVLDTLAHAQPTPQADPARIIILRPDADGKHRTRMTIDLDEMVTLGDTSLNAMLEEGDIIYVPANNLAKVGLAFQQLLFPLGPVLGAAQAPSDISYATAGQRPYGAGNE